MTLSGAPGSRLRVFALAVFGLSSGCGDPADDSPDPLEISDIETVTQAAVDLNPVEEHNGWWYYPIAGANCMESLTNEALGIGYRPAPPGSVNANKLLIFFDGGGACFNKANCELVTGEHRKYTEVHFDDETEWTLAKGEGQLIQGVFDSNEPLNPTRDWHHVFIPYCTGDFHAGNRVNGTVPNVSGEKQFIGYNNTTLFFNYIVNTILPKLGTGTRRVILTGESAGGFGAALNADRFKRMLPTNVTLSVVVDSAPMLTSAYMPGPKSSVNVQSTIRSLFNFSTLLANCGTACASTTNWFQQFHEWTVKRNPSVRFAHVSSNADDVVRFALGSMGLGCSQTATWLVASTDLDCWIPKLTFQSGIENLRTRLRSVVATNPGQKFGTFFLTEPDGDEERHTWIAWDRFYGPEAREQNVGMYEWFRDIANDVATFRHIGP